MDNASIHHVNKTVKMIQEVCSLIHFQPPYSPDPIEADMSTDIETLVLSAFH